MRNSIVLTSAALLVLGGTGAAQAQQNAAFPHAARHEVQMINGIPCRTMLVKGTHTRVPVECAGQSTMRTFDPTVTGGIHIQPADAATMAATPFPNAARHEVQIINGVPCRTVLLKGTTTRVPVECAQ